MVKRITQALITLSLSFWVTSSFAADLVEAYRKAHSNAAVKNLPANIGQSYFAILITNDKLIANSKYKKISEKIDFLLESQYKAGTADIDKLKQGKLSAANLKNEALTYQKNLKTQVNQLEKLIGTAYNISKLYGLEVNHSLSSFNSSLGLNSAEVNQAYNDVLAAEKSVAQAREEHQKIKTEYNAGKHTALLLLLAEKALIKTQVNYNNVRYQYLITTLETLSKSGNLSYTFLKKINDNLTKDYELLLPKS